MSPELRSFLTAWLDWAEAGAEQGHSLFRRDEGLCSCSRNWDTLYNDGVDDQLTQLLVNDFDGCYTYPFGGEGVFWVNRRERTMHLNGDRLRWVRSKVR